MTGGPPRLAARHSRRVEPAHRFRGASDEQKAKGLEFIEAFWGN
jgi:hypothetical protein